MFKPCCLRIMGLQVQDVNRLMKVAGEITMMKAGKCGMVNVLRDMKGELPSVWVRRDFSC